MIALSLIGLSLPGWAGSISVQVVPVQVFVDGRRVPINAATGQAEMERVTGRHLVEIRTPDGRVLAKQSIRLGRRDSLALHYDGVDLVIGSVPHRRRPTPPTPPVPQPDAPQAMSDAELQQLLQELDDQSFDDDRVAVLQLAMRDRYLTVAQLGQIIEEFSFGDGEVAATKTCASQLVDPENAYLLRKYFTFGKDADEAMKVFAEPS